MHALAKKKKKKRRGNSQRKENNEIKLEKKTPTKKTFVFIIKELKSLEAKWIAKRLQGKISAFQK